MVDWSRFFVTDSDLRRYSPFLLSLFILALVVSDILKPGRIVVHWQMVALIGMLMITPFLPLIKSVSYGDLEVNLDEQVKEAEEAIEEDLPVPEGVETSDYLPEGTIEKLYSLYEVSHIAALAMLRTEIEVVLREIAGDSDTERPRGYGHLMNEIRSQEKLSRGTLHAIEEVRSLANVAIHEKGASEDEAREILDLGINALERLHYYKEEGIPKNPDQ